MVSTSYDDENGIRPSRGEGLNFEKGQRIFFQLFMPKGKPVNYYDQTHRGFGYVTLPTQFESESKESLPSHSSNSSN